MMVKYTFIRPPGQCGPTIQLRDLTDARRTKWSLWRDLGEAYVQQPPIFGSNDDDEKEPLTYLNTIQVKVFILLHKLHGCLDILIISTTMEKEENENEQEEGDKKKKKKSASKYNYTFGDVYPGVVIGHKQCLLHRTGLPVPANMGWLWNSPDVPGMKAVRKGWSPGVIGKSVAKLMTFKCPRGGGDKDKNKKKKKKGNRPGADIGGGDSEPDEPLEPKPTLKVQRKGDVFTIQVNPLKDLTDILPNEDPYVDCDPMIFKIIKKRSPEEQAKVEARKMVKLKKQRDAEIRKALAEAVEDICKCAYMDVYCNDLTAIDKVIDSCPAFKDPDCICKEESLSSLSSNATWDIEYTPPFGCFDLSPRKRTIFIHVGTQYVPADAGIVEPPPKPRTCRRSCTSLRPRRKIFKKSCCVPCT